MRCASVSRLLSPGSCTVLPDFSYRSVAAVQIAFRGTFCVRIPCIFRAARTQGKDFLHNRGGTGFRDQSVPDRADREDPLHGICAL